jgi:NSS family neurotransmitter:Na+ symporter
MSRTESFTSRWGLLLAVLGLAVGTGNIWRFPRIIAQYGGAFLIPWALFLFTWAIPLILIEFGMGKQFRMGPIGAYGKLSGRKNLWMGGFIVACSAAIAFYYSVVTGWCLKYIYAAGSGVLMDKDHGDYWSTFTTQSWEPLFFHLVAVGIGVLVIRFGVTGIERASKFLVPALFILLVVAVIRAVTLPGAVTGLNYFFNPDFSQLLHSKIWLEALTQMAWSTGAGWGLIASYAVYLRKDDDVSLNSFLTGFGDCSAALIAGLAVLPTIFALLPVDRAMEAVQSGNYGLTFMWIPELFEMIPGGQIFMTLFFIALFFAALTSLISMIELASRALIDGGLRRQRAILIVGAIVFLAGVPSAINMAVFDNQDWVWGVGLMLSGLIFAVGVIRYGAKRFRLEILQGDTSAIRISPLFDICVKYIFPLEFVILLGWWFYQAIEANPGTWWHPISRDNVGTLLLQWGVVLLLFRLMNNWIARKYYDRG